MSYEKEALLRQLITGVKLVRSGEMTAEECMGQLDVAVREYEEETDGQKEEAT